jgi:hypothetical protein
VETIRRERPSSRLDSSRGSHAFHPRPPPFNNGTSMLDTTKQQLDFMDSELPRFLQSGALEPGQRNIWVSKLFLVPKPGENK